MITPDGIQTILFDLDGTLRDNHPPSHQVFFDHAVSLGLQDSPEGRRRALRWAHAYWADSDELSADLATFGGGSEAFWLNYSRRQLAAFGCPPKQAQALAPAVVQHMAESYDPDDIIPEDVPETLQTLKGAGFTLGVVSNRSEAFGEYLAQVGLAVYVDFSLSAGEANSWKPDPGIFIQALRLASCQPEQAIYVGDNYYADVVGAGRVGIRPVLIDPQQVFPAPGCTVIHTLNEVLQLLEVGHPHG